MHKQVNEISGLNGGQTLLGVEVEGFLLRALLSFCPTLSPNLHVANNVASCEFREFALGCFLATKQTETKDNPHPDSKRDAFRFKDVNAQAWNLSTFLTRLPNPVAACFDLFFYFSFLYIQKKNK